MKNLISFITLLIFLLSITNYMIVTEAKDGLLVPVLDSDGEELKVGTRYFVLGAAIFPAGGLIPYPLPNKTCTFGVAQRVLGDGIPVIFSPVNSKRGDVIFESTDLNIRFSPRIFCDPSSVWRVDEYDESAKKNFVMTGRVAGNPGNETINNWFQIEKVSSDFGTYKFVFCPKVCEFCAVICSDVGIYYHEEVRRLALGGNFPSAFIFRKSVLNNM